MPDITINGPEGKLEGKFKQGLSDNAPIALILHPHPQHGGSMNNKVVYAMYHAFVKKGFSTLRFNFRGVGNSQGSYDNGEGELLDAACAFDWLQNQQESASCSWIAGFSFGSWISLQLLMRRPNISNFIAVSPPSNMFDFSFINPCPAPGLFIQGEQDELVPEPTTRELAKQLPRRSATQKNSDILIEYCPIPGAGHFYSNHLGLMITQIEAYIDRQLSKQNTAPNAHFSESFPAASLIS